MSDELHKYPGNLKHHKVDPLLSDADLIEKFRVKHDEEYDGYAHGIAGINNATHVRNVYESARAKDAELIQRLVDGWFANDNGEKMVSAINEAISAGFKPSEQ